MIQVIRAKNISLIELHTQFRLQSTSDKMFFSEWQNTSSCLSECEYQQLGQVREHYLKLASYRNSSEEAVKMIVLSPLLDLAGFYQASFALQTEETVEIEAKDDDLLVKGKIDVLMVRQQFWVLVIESKSTRFDVLTALPQVLTYMLDNPQKEHPVYGLLVNGREFVFVKLVKTNESNTTPIYARSYALSVERDGDLEQVLGTLKTIRQNILAADY